jgi:hypothetical protein
MPVHDLLRHPAFTCKLMPEAVRKASAGLEPRYRGGTGYAMDAAMHHSGNLIFVAAVEKKLCGFVENELIWQGKTLPHLQQPGQNCAANPPHASVAFRDTTDLERFRCR